MLALRGGLCQAEGLPQEGDAMTRFSLAFVVSALVAAPALAEEPLDTAGFEARVTGQTLRFSAYGQSYGAEQYLPGRQVLWAFEGSGCRKGRWYEAAPGEICFSYEHDPTPQCWNFFDRNGRLGATFLGPPPATELLEASRSPQPLDCPGPEVGA